MSYPYLGFYLLHIWRNTSSCWLLSIQQSWMPPLLLKPACLTHLSLDKMATIWQKIFSEAFTWMKSFCILIKISLKFLPKGPIDNNTALVEIMAWRQIGDEPLSEPMLTRFPDAYMRHYGEMSYSRADYASGKINVFEFYILSIMKWY